jgi:hypothetical protein
MELLREISLSTGRPKKNALSSAEFERVFKIKEELVCRKTWKTVAPIDHTERRHDVTFISVDVESQENLCKIFYRILTKENKRKHRLLRASCGIFIEKTDEISRTLH